MNLRFAGRERWPSLTSYNNTKFWGLKRKWLICNSVEQFVKIVGMKKKTKPSPKATSSAVVIDFPTQEEQVMPGHYAIRLTAPGAAEVQVSIAGGDWQGCRESAGHFWYDWRPEQEGPCAIEARARSGKGRWSKSEPCDCVVCAA